MRKQHTIHCTRQHQEQQTKHHPRTYCNLLLGKLLLLYQTAMTGQGHGNPCLAILCKSLPAETLHTVQDHFMLHVLHVSTAQKQCNGLSSKLSLAWAQHVTCRLHEEKVLRAWQQHYLCRAVYAEDMLDLRSTQIAPDSGTNTSNDLSDTASPEQVSVCQFTHAASGLAYIHSTVLQSVNCSCKKGFCMSLACANAEIRDIEMVVCAEFWAALAAEQLTRTSRTHCTAFARP